MEHRYLQMHDIQSRSAEEGDDLFLEGYFAVYDDVYNIGEGATESIARGAFTESIGGDVRALYNHNDDVILGRTTSGTLVLEDRERGLWGRIKVNRNDTEAMNVYERILRGDISGCSFGFNIESEESTVTDNGDVHFTITKVNPLYEISPCVFPAYTSTSVQARSQESIEEIRMKFELVKREEWKAKMLNKLKGDSKDGIESVNAQEEN